MTTAPDRTMRLFPRQARFVRDSRRFLAAIGGIGSGKTFVGAAKVISRLSRRELGIIAAPTYKMLRDSTQRTLFDMLGEMEIPYKYHKTDNRVEFPHSGHEILFRSLDDPDNLRGPNVSYAWVDEAAYVTVKAWRVLKGRVRVGDQQQLWITTTPKGRNWIYNEWVIGPTARHFMYRFRTDENPTLDSEFIDSLGFTGNYALQEIGGEFVSFEGLVYGGFDREKHVLETKLDTSDWYAVQGVDIGARNPTVVLTVYFSADGRVHVGREFYQRNMSGTAIRGALLSEFEEVLPAEVYMDPSARAYILDMEEEGIPVEKADNDIVTGIQSVSSVITENFTVDASCVHTIAEFEAYQYPEEGKGGSNGDRPIKQNDHCMDALRYGVMGYYRGVDLTGASGTLDQIVARQLAGGVA